MKGRFFTFEGGEGAGKTTQMKIIKERLESSGYRVTVTREPGGTPLAEEIRKLILTTDPLLQVKDPITLSLLFSAARRDHVEKIIKPGVDRGEIVLCDRFTDSTWAYQRTDENEIILKTIIDIGSHEADTGFRPDARIYLDILPERANERRLARNKNMPVDQFEAKDLNFHHRVRNNFLTRKKDPNFHMVDADRDPSTVANDILSILKGVAK